ncbi:LOW QUALITY PROTEIN: hypothetical protein QYF61_001800 [Mycteria americana]|uniref:Integrase catalytic domain-containing protein n=1 Tax=Mycteria americana TaxID=33587 RepID=A0AAN7S567_MYCAM|nr:LOW QUALITY PROTEIN: hypothetical protein QYF61_001800 [Mycteria americana]
MDTIARVTHECETCAAIKQAKWLKPLCYGGRWLKYQHGEAWQIDYITLPQTRQGKRYVLTMVEATTGWLETYPVPHATARTLSWALKSKSCGDTAPQIESDNRTHFQNNLIGTWAKQHGIEWVFAGSHRVSPSPSQTNAVPLSSPRARWAPAPWPPLPDPLLPAVDFLVPLWFLLQGLTPALGQGFAFASAELHVAPVSPFLQPAQVPLDPSPAHQHIDRHPHPTRFIAHQLNFFACSTCRTCTALVTGGGCARLTESKSHFAASV